MTVQSLRPGDTLEFSMSTIVHTALAPGQFWTEYDFGNTGVVLDEQFDIDVPADVPVKVKTLPGFDAGDQGADGRRSITGDAARLARKSRERRRDGGAAHADEPEPRRRPPDDFQDWEDVGRWYAGLWSAHRSADAGNRGKARS